MHDQLVYPNEAPPSIKACIMHPSIESIVVCERPGNEDYVRVVYGMCVACATRLEVDVPYIKQINRRIDIRLTEVQKGIE